MFQDRHYRNVRIDDIITARKKIVTPLIEYQELRPAIISLGNIIVDTGDSNAQFQTIQAAIDHAATLGPTFDNFISIFVKPGSYAGFNLHTSFIVVIGIGGAGPINPGVRVNGSVTISADLAGIDNMFITGSPALCAVGSSGSAAPLDIIFVQNCLFQRDTVGAAIEQKQIMVTESLLLINCIVNSLPLVAGGIGLRRTGGGTILRDVDFNGTVIPQTDRSLSIQNDNRLEVKNCHLGVITFTVAMGVNAITADPHAVFEQCSIVSQTAGGNSASAVELAGGTLVLFGCHIVSKAGSGDWVSGSGTVVHGGSFLNGSDTALGGAVIETAMSVIA